MTRMSQRWSSGWAFHDKDFQESTDRPSGYQVRDETASGRNADSDGDRRMRFGAIESVVAISACIIVVGILALLESKQINN